MGVQRNRIGIGIGTYLALTLSSLTLLLTLILVQVIGDVAGSEVESRIGQNLAELAFQTTDKLDRGMFERYREVQLLAARPEFGDPAIASERKRALLDALQQTYPYYAWLGLTDNAGNVHVASGKLLEGVDVSKRPWFARAYQQQFITDVHAAVLLAKLLPNPTNEPKRFFDLAFPYRRPDGQVAGILGIHLSWQWAAEVQKSVLRPLADRSKVETLIVSQDGTVLLGPAQLLEKKLAVNSLSAAQTNGTGFAAEKWPDGKRYLVGYSLSRGYASYPGVQWRVLVRQDLDEAYQPVVQLQQSIFWGGLAIAALFSALGFGVASWLARPLRSVARSAAKIEAGQAGTIDAGIGGYREVNTLTASLNSLVGKLVTNETRLRELNATLEHRVEERTSELAQALDVVRHSQQRVQTIIETALDAFVGMDAQGRVIDWNRQAQAIFGWSREDAVGRQMDALIMPERYRPAHRAGMARFLQDGHGPVLGQRLQMSAMRRGGEEFPIEMTIGVIDTGKERFFGAFINDISARKKAEQELADSRHRLATITDNMPALISYIDADERYQFNNKTFEDWFGQPRQAVYGKTVRDVMGDEDYLQVRPHIEAALSGRQAVFEHENRDEAGVRHLENTFLPHWQDGKVIGVYVMVQDVTARKIQENYFRHFAMHDALTGLANRKACLERIDHAMARVKRGAKPMAVLFLDLDKFKHINDTCGHETGDRVLIAFGERISKCVRRTDMVARLGGDEFVVVAESLTDANDALLIGEKIGAELQPPLIDHPSLLARTSIGIALYEGGGETCEGLLNRADQAMYIAKRDGSQMHLSGAVQI